jgi:hypothetical protein
MGAPAELTPLDRTTARELADLVFAQIDADEDLPQIDDTRAWLLAGEIKRLRAEAENAEAAWSATVEVYEAALKDLRDKLEAATAKDPATNTSVGLLRVQRWSLQQDLKRIRGIVQLARDAQADGRLDVDGLLESIDLTARHDHG